MIETNERVKILMDIEKTYGIIYMLCREYLYYPPDRYQESCQHILTASTLLYNEAARIWHENILYGKMTHLTLTEIDELLKKICHILNMAETIDDKELLIAEVLDSYNLKPEILLIKDEWNGNFVEKALKMGI